MGRGVLQTRRRFRAMQKQELRDKKITAAQRRRIWGVRLTAIAMPGWAADRRIKGLSFSESFVWLKPRDARFLMARDRECGGEPRAAETEYRRCPVCSRPLIEDDARMRRALDESCQTGRQLPCGPECIEASMDKRWME